MRNCTYKLRKFKCNMKTGLELNWVCRSQAAKEYVVFLNRQKDKDFALVVNLFSFWQLTSIFSEYERNAMKKMAFDYARVGSLFTFSGQS